jgi:zinc and cadmium transporter
VNKALVLNNILGDSLHNFLDGIAIAASFGIGFPIGVATTIAILTHELPQELAEYGVLVHAGLRKKHALLLNFISGLLAVAGVLAFSVLGDSIEGIEPYVLSFTAGIFIYIATADLFPEIHKENGRKLQFLQVGFVLMGVLLMLLLRAYD